MFTVPADAWYAYAGVAAASLVVFGVAAGLPTAPPPDASSAARTVDRVASSHYTASASHALDADSMRLTSRGLTLRTDAGNAHATFRYGPVTPVRRGTELGRVLGGADPTRVFGSSAQLRNASAAARSRDPSWRPAPGRLHARRVTWGSVNVTLVG
jgi:hypothetical protein